MILLIALEAINTCEYLIACNPFAFLFLCFKQIEFS